MFAHRLRRYVLRLLTANVPGLLLECFSEEAGTSFKPIVFCLAGCLPICILQKQDFTS